MNFLGLLGQIARLLPGYVQGERQATTDNWNDLNQYNQVWNGQMANALNEATFPAQVNTMLANAANAQLQSRQGGLNFLQNLMTFPYNTNNMLWRAQNTVPMWQMGMQQQQQALQQGQQALQQGAMNIQQAQQINPLMQSFLQAQIQQLLNNSQPQAPQLATPTPQPSTTMTPEQRAMSMMPSQQAKLRP